MVRGVIHFTLDHLHQEFIPNGILISSLITPMELAINRLKPKLSVPCSSQVLPVG
jgi:hypothetical protein